jgi:hypothetical protein
MRVVTVQETTSLASPPAARVGRPGWLDTRLVAGVLLVLLSVVVGARLLASADDSEPVWIAAHDLAPGSQIAAGDLRRGRVHLYGDASRYVSGSAAAPIGYVLTRGVGADELLPVGAIVDPHTAHPFRLVTVPVDQFHLPPHLASGERVDVYVTPHTTSDRPGRATVVYAGAVVASIDTGSHGLGGGGTSGVGVVLSVPPRAAADLVTALHAGDVDLVRVPA